MAIRLKSIAAIAGSAVLTCGIVAALSMQAQAASSRFRCEYRPVPQQESRIDFDATGLPPGSYKAEVTSKGGVNIAVASQTANNGEVSFGFRSNGGDDTYVDPGFIVGLKASGRIIDSKGNTLAMVADVSCRKKN